MDNSTKIFIGIWAIIIILVIFNILISIKEVQFKKDCTIDYSSYLKENKCPCVNFHNVKNVTLLENSSFSKSYNFSIDMSIKK